MNYNKKFEEVRLVIRKVDLAISEELQLKIPEMIKRMQRYIAEINMVEIYLKKEYGQSTDRRAVSVRLSIRGNDVFASNSGNYWTGLQKNFEEKLRRQLRGK